MAAPGRSACDSDSPGVGEAAQHHQHAQQPAGGAHQHRLGQGALHELVVQWGEQPVHVRAARGRRGRRVLVVVLVPGVVVAAVRALVERDLAVDQHQPAAVGRAQALAGEGARGRPEGELPPVDQQHLRRALAGEGEVVRRHQHRAPLGALLVQGAQDRRLGHRVDAGQGLVQQQHVAALHERPREQDALALAARERAERRRRPGPRGRRGRAPRAPRPARGRPAAGTTARVRRRPSARRRAP